MYPLKRNRRLRSSEAIRSMVREQQLAPSDFIVPLFVVEGSDIKEEIASMPELLSNEFRAFEKRSSRALEHGTTNGIAFC